MTEEMPTAWAEHLGPCYTVAGMARILKWMEADVLEAGKDLRLLMLPTDDDDVYLFPALQFQDGKVFERLNEVLVIFQTMTDDPWAWAHWMTPAIPENRSRENLEQLSDVSLAVAFGGLPHNWWWITRAESSDAEVKDRR